jgi:hypothetical protein
MDYNFFPNEESLMKAQIYNIEANSAYGDPLFNNPQKMDFSVTENSPALKLGFVNFPMDKFGVQKPLLKALAKAPEVPVMKNHDEIDKISSPIVDWLRNKIKSVESKEEQSAFGLDTAEGVLVLRVWSGSPASQEGGLRQGDVILELEGEKVKNIKEFFAILKEKYRSETLQVVVMRNQTEQELMIKLK